MTDIFKKAFYLLKLLARENNRVQYHIMERLDILLDVRVVESDLAIALKEVMKNVYIIIITPEMYILNYSTPKKCICKTVIRNKNKS